jgi:hypothetical protein
VPAPAPGAPSAVRSGTLSGVARPRASSVTLVLAVYVVPLTAAVIYLAAVGLPLLAVALAVVELTMVGLIWLARRGATG